MSTDPNKPKRTQPKKKPKIEETPLDQGFFGKWGYRIRNFCGAITVICICVNSTIFCWTIHESIAQGNGWPDWISIGFITCGPIIIGWSFMNVRKILSVLVKHKDEDPSILDKMKNAVEGFKSKPEDKK